MSSPREVAEQTAVQKIVEVASSWILMSAPVGLAFAGGLHYGKAGFAAGLGFGMALMLSGFNWLEGRDFYAW